MDIQVADCIDLTIQMALENYDGILPLLPGDDLLKKSTEIENSGSVSDHGGGSNSGSDAFSEDFLKKCGIYPGDQLFKLKKCTIATRGDPNVVPLVEEVVGMSQLGPSMQCTRRSDTVH